MAKINDRAVKTARVHQPCHIPGMGSLGPGAIDVNSVKGELGKLKMTKVEGGLHLESGKIEGFIPDANLVVVEFFPEQAPVTAKAK